MQALILWLVFFIILFSAALLAAAYYHSKALLDPAKHRTPISIWPDKFNLIFEPVEFMSADGVQLKGWFVPADEFSDKTIILCHGWGTNKGEVMSNTYFLQSLGFNLFYFDFRGNGESGGSLSSVGYLETRDFEAAYAYLKDVKGEQAQELGVYGISMGAAVSAYCAARLPDIKCFACEAAFSSFAVVAGRWAWLNMKIPYYPLMPLTLMFVRMRLKTDPEPFSTVYNIDKISPRPIFFIHGSHDALAPVAQAKALFEKAGEPKHMWVVPGAGHAKCAEIGGNEYRQRLGKFFTDCFASKEPAESSDSQAS
jgi:pimeloyl-ACP methyl ester carboxylesterase